MSFEEEHVAHPRLYGAPAYARPPMRFAASAMPVDPDDLPIAAHQTDDEREIVESLLSQPFGIAVAAHDAEPPLRPERLSLAARASRLLVRAS